MVRQKDSGFERFLSIMSYIEKNCLLIINKATLQRVVDKVPSSQSNSNWSLCLHLKYVTMWQKPLINLTWYYFSYFLIISSFKILAE